MIKIPVVIEVSVFGITYYYIMLQLQLYKSLGISIVLPNDLDDLATEITLVRILYQK